MSFVVPDLGFAPAIFSYFVIGSIDIAGGNSDSCQVMATCAVRRFSAPAASHAIITAAMKVHSELGPGLLENAYQACLQHELRQAGLRSEAQVGLPVVYHGTKLDLGYRMDLLVEDLVIVEIKSVEAVSRFITLR